MPEPETIGATTGLPAPESIAEASELLYERIRQAGVDLEKYRTALYDLLLSPYFRSSPAAITQACFLIGHPRRPPTLATPDPEGHPCVCGHVKAKGEPA